MVRCRFGKNIKHKNTFFIYSRSKLYTQIKKQEEKVLLGKEVKRLTLL